MATFVFLIIRIVVARFAAAFIAVKAAWALGALRQVCVHVSLVTAAAPPVVAFLGHLGRNEGVL